MQKNRDLRRRRLLIPALLLSATLLIAAVVPASAATSGWNIVPSPNTSTTQRNQLDTVACATSTECFAVELYVNSGGYYQTLIEKYNGTSWNIVSSPNTSTSQNNVLWGVTCVSAADCWATGFYDNTGGYAQTLIEKYDGASWNIVSSSNTSTTQNNVLPGVSCLTASDCWAVGYAPASGGGSPQTLFEQYNGTSWSIVTSPNTSTTQENVIGTVSCDPTSGDCWAVGEYYNTSGYAQTLIEEYNGTSWSIVTSPNTSTTHGNYLASVTCVSASDCWATGFYDNTGGYRQTLIEQYNGTSWNIVSSPNTSTIQDNLLQGVACVSSTDCWAVGNYCTDGSACSAYVQTLIEQYNGTSWNIVPSSNTSTTQNNFLTGIACVGSTTCFATAGYYPTSGSEQTLIERYTAPPSTTTLSASANPIRSGQSVTLTARVSPSTATGTVEFKNGTTPISGCSGVTLNSGTATCTTSFSTTGSYSLSAFYSGDGTDAPSSGVMAAALTVDAAVPVPSTGVTENHTYGVVVVAGGITATLGVLLLIGVEVRGRQLLR